MKKFLTFIILALTTVNVGCLTTKPYNSSPEYTAPPEVAESYMHSTPTPAPAPRRASPPPAYSTHSEVQAPYGAPATDPGMLPVNSADPMGSEGQAATPTPMPNPAQNAPTGPVPNPSYKLVPKPIAPAPTGTNI